MSDYAEQIPDHEKVRIVSHFIKNAPPGEFNEVFNDVRVLLGNDQLLKEGASSAFIEYNTDQFTPAKIGDDMVLVTGAGKIEGPGSKFVDPRGKRSFKYDHLRKEASDVQAITPDPKCEPFRSSLDKSIQAYVKQHYPEGVVSVYGSSSGTSIKLTVCIEDHKFSPQNFWNGRWRSEWTMSFTPGGNADLKGTMRVQVHYYEDGNVQLVSSKQVTDSVQSGSEDSTSKNFLKAIEVAENEYQAALAENYKTMSQTTFKALRRQLPVTRTKVDWNKIAAYNIGTELKTK